MQPRTKGNLGVATSLFQFYLFGNVHISLCAIALVCGTCSVLDLHVRPEWLFVVFGGTLSLYSYQRWIGVKQQENIHYKGLAHQWNIRNQRILLALSIAGIVLAGIAIFSLSKQAWFVVLLTGFLSLLYSAPILKGKRKRVRDITGAKILMIALTWTLVCIWIPVADKFKPSLVQVFSSEFSYVWKWSLVTFLMIFSLTIPFDVRDIEFDKGVLRSLPMRIGEKPAVRLAMVLLLISAIVFWRFESNIVHNNFPKGAWRGYVLWSTLSMAILSRCTSKRHEYYFSFGIDGLIILLPFFLAILGNS